MIAEKTATPVEALQERILKLEQDLARVQAEFQDVKNDLAEVLPVIRRKAAFRKAADEVFTEYSDLLQRLAD
ncbi:hypothetical protein JIN84_06510 [Luteolibacter yonseiensis]|uniref:Uncharacterized protein n=1 Tax=Luteolibacter yonseiensis TaxID=1144680 RepID=A0A934V6P2_9BACT|nr:hypothetical protein [Luteolibacter yonseiensis]MBK1815257.1 hypothetical protein [Luteolibacter yonseiensis]